MYPEKPMCHEINPVFKIGDNITWQTRGQWIRNCSYCGSVHPEDLLRLFERGAFLQGSDWKYGWPHKYYIENAGDRPLKFYTEHLKDLLGEPEFEIVARAIHDKFTGEYYPRVAFLDEGRLTYVTGVHGTYDDKKEWARKEKEKQQENKE